MDPTPKNIQPDKTLAAVCGLFCPACTIYIGSKQDPARLQKLAERSQVSIEEMHCEGCRAEKRTLYCQTCKLVKCTAEKGLDFCGECESYPCKDLADFQSARPHRIELWEAQERIRTAGYETWFEEMVQHYTCPQCQTINSAYDFTCRRCGASPGSEYVSQHKVAILQYMSARK